MKWQVVVRDAFGITGVRRIDVCCSLQDKQQQQQQHWPAAMMMGWAERVRES